SCCYQHGRSPRGLVRPAIGGLTRHGDLGMPTSAARFLLLSPGGGVAGGLAALFAQAHRQLDRGAGEAEVLAETALDEPAVGLLKEPGGEQDEVRGFRARLGGEQNPRLLAAAQRRRGGGDQG